MAKHRSTNKKHQRFKKTFKQKRNNNRTSKKNNYSYSIPRVPNERVTPPTGSGSPPKVALLFLTTGNHEQSHLWETFLGHPDTHKKFSIYCHCACPRDVPARSFLRGFRNSDNTTTSTPPSSEGLLPRGMVVPKPYNEWGHLVLAYYQLLHRAYTDTRNNNQRFVYLSETCAPCVPALAAYAFLTRQLDVTYMDAPRPKDNSERYEQVVHSPWRSMWPWKVNAGTKAIAKQDCSKVFSRAGITKGAFFKHSGWFSPNREDAFRLLQHQRGFEALNLISAGDEHLLSILHEASLVPPSQLLQHRVTHVRWDYDKMRRWEELKKKSQQEGYWATIDALEKSNPKAHATFTALWEESKYANMHPIEYTITFTKKHLEQCVASQSVFVRKVRKSCNVDVLLKHISDVSS